MTCKHPKRSRWAVNYSDGGRLVWRIDCLRCGGVVPFGPASDAAPVFWEVFAARTAAGDDFQPKKRQAAAMPFVAGYFDGETSYEHLPSSSLGRRLYDAGMLTRVIRDHGKERR